MDRADSTKNKLVLLKKSEPIIKTYIERNKPKEVNFTEQRHRSATMDPVRKKDLIEKHERKLSEIKETFAKQEVNKLQDTRIVDLKQS